MHIETIKYLDGTQTLIGTLISPAKATSPSHAVLLFPAFEGPAPFAVDYAKKLCETGLIVFIVDMYGNASTGDTLEECFKLYEPLSKDRAMVRRRAVLAFETLKKQKNVDPEKIGAMGFCFGGTCALELVRSGAPLRAGVFPHTGLTKSSLETHPIKTKLLILNGFQDPQIPAFDSLKAFSEEMTAAGNTDWIFTFFGDTKHSFTDPRTGSFDAEREKMMGRAYNARSADFSFRYAVDFFKKEL